MITYVSILRGINVGGNNKIKMAELKEALNGLGLENLTTYIQSGNIVYQFKNEKTDTLSNLIRNKILETFELDIPTITIPAIEFKKIVQENPFRKKDADVSKLYLTILEKPLKQFPKDLLEKVNIKNDQYIFDKRVIYLYFPDGYGTTKLSNNFWERKLQTMCTTRNLKTSNKIIEICESL